MYVSLTHSLLVKKYIIVENNALVLLSLWYLQLYNLLAD